MFDPAALVPILGFAGAVVVAFIGWLQHRGSKAAETKSANVQTEIKLLRNRLDDQEKEINTLKDQMKEVQQERDALWRENRDLRDENRDQAELIDDVMAHFSDTEAWSAAGGHGAAPVHSWRIRSAIAEYRAQKGQPRAQPPTDKESP